ncbi:MAG: hypothetical protein PVH22_15815 [Desulfobacteraceae bacterium]
MALNTSLPVLLSSSVAVTVITLSPVAKSMPDIAHASVPVADPDVGVQVGQDHVTDDTVPLSEAVPDRFIVDDPVE